jgi:hypothetical protein
MTIATQGDLINARTNKNQGISFQRASMANQTAGTLCSLWRSTGPVPSQAAIPTAAALCTKATSGALRNFQNPIGGDKTYLDVIDVNCTLAGKVALYDRLFHIGGLNGTLTTAQAVNSQTVLTFPVRNSVADECEWWLEWYADTGGTAVTATCAVTYTDTTTANLAVAVPATCRAARLLPIVPGAGKVIASVQTVTLSATTAAAGNFGVTCADRLAGCGATVVAANIPQPAREAVLHEVPNDACLMQIVECSSTASGDVRGEYTLIQG